MSEEVVTTEPAGVEETSYELEVQRPVEAEHQDLPDNAPLALISEAEPELDQPVAPGEEED